MFVKLSRQVEGSLAGTATAFVIGQALLASLLLLISLGGFLNMKVVVVVLSLCLLSGGQLGLKCLKDSGLMLVDELQSLLRRDVGIFLIALLLFVTIILISLSSILRGPIGDAEAFYMVYAKVIASSGKLDVARSIYEDFSQIGLLAEFHFAALLLLDGLPAAKLFVVAVGLSAAVILMDISKSAGLGRLGQWISIIILMTSTAFTNHLWDGKVDIFAVALALAAVSCIVSSEKISSASLRYSGLLAGFSAITKFSYIPSFMISMVLLIAWRVYLTDEYSGMLLKVKRVVNGLFTFCLWGTLAWVPHFVKNWVLFEAPLAPFVGGGDQSWLNQVWFSALDTAWIVATYPFALVFGRYPMQGGNLSFLIVCFLPLALFIPKPVEWRKSPVVQLSVVAIVGLIAWILLRPSVIAPRYYFAVPCLLIPLIARGAEYVYESERKPRYVSLAMLSSIAVALLFSSFPHLSMPVYAAKAAIGDSPKCELAGSYCQPLTDFNKLVGTGKRVYYAGYYSYWLRPDLLMCRETKQEIKGLEKRSLDNPWEYLADRGFDYIIADKQTHLEIYENLQLDSMSSLPEISPVLQMGQMVIIELAARDGNEIRRPECIEVTPGRWTVKEMTDKHR